MAALRRPGGLAPSGPSELRQRTWSSVVLGLLALASAWFGGVVFAAFWTAAAIAVFVEWVAVTRAEPQRALKSLGSAGLALLVGAYFLALGGWVILGLALLGLLVLAGTGRGLHDRGWSAGGFAYAAPIALVPIALREQPQFGLPAILWIFAVVWTTDIAAYFGGRSIGGPKLWPAVSPKKTWSGCICGLVGGVLAGWAVTALAAGQGAPVALAPGSVLIVSALASLASQAGDLAESAMKRGFGVKDSGQLIPGHGGAMDRLDGFAAVTFPIGLALLGAMLAGRCCSP